MSEKDDVKAFLMSIADGARATPGVLCGSLRGFRGGYSRSAYFDFDQYIRDPGHMVKATQYYVLILSYLVSKRGLDLLAFVKKNDMDDTNTLGVIPLIGLICSDPSLRLPHVVVRLDRLLPHDRIKLDTARGRSRALEGRLVAVITDHVSRGEELYQAIVALKQYGAEVTDAVTFSVWKDLFDDSYGPKIANLGTQFHYLHELKEKEAEGKSFAELVPNREEIDRIADSVPA